MFAIAGIIFAIVAPFYVHKNAKQTGQAILFWTFMSILAGVVSQIIIPVVIWFSLGVSWEVRGSTFKAVQEETQLFTVPVSVVALFLTAVGHFSIMKKVTTLNEDNIENNMPPPPTFE
jgi:H+/Cl- antiporter ClcA